MKATCLLISLCFFLFSGAQDIRRQLQAQFIESPDGATIEIPEGRFQLNMALWMDGKKNIILKGKGMDKTILSFKDLILPYRI
jgi:hypothetical protein